jgi:hypothetical protein
MAAILLISSVAFPAPRPAATTLTTPLIYNPTGMIPACVEANVGRSSLTITVTECDNCGDPKSLSCSSEDVTLEPGQVIPPPTVPLSCKAFGSLVVGLCTFTFTGAATDVSAGTVTDTKQIVPAQ